MFRLLFGKFGHKNNEMSSLDPEGEVTGGIGEQLPTGNIEQISYVRQNLNNLKFEHWPNMDYVNVSVDG